MKSSDFYEKVETFSKLENPSDVRYKAVESGEGAARVRRRGVKPGLLRRRRTCKVKRRKRERGRLRRQGEWSGGRSGGGEKARALCTGDAG